MGLITEYVEVGICPINRKHYENLGYIIPKQPNDTVKQGTKILAKVSDLTCGSKIIIDCECDNCKKLIHKQYSTYLKQNHNGKTYCADCVNGVLHSGKNNVNYKSDKTLDERYDDRSYPEYREFVKRVMIRDKYSCQCCGSSKSNSLIVHHLYSYKAYKDLRTEDSNGITLCKNCHKNFHNKYGNGNNTKEQFLEWLGKVSLELKKYDGVLPANRSIYNYEKDVIYKNGAWGAINDLNIKSYSSICSCCSTNSSKSNMNKYRCHTLNGCHLFWYDEYKKMTQEEINSFVNYVPKSYKKIICLTTGEIFDKIKYAGECYNININSLVSCCKHRYSYAGKLPNGTKLEWMYYDEYLKQKVS